ncbi:MAG: YicC/YloC family endoribonuclease [Clostridia bacterium]
MQSMTGYGKGVSSENGKTITFEVKTVNHRYLDWGIKLPKQFLFIEDGIKKIVGGKISRGHIDIFLTYEQASVQSGKFSVDIDLAKNFIASARRLQAETGLTDDLTLTTLLRTPDILTRGVGEENEEELASLAFSALSTAMDNLIVMRKKEGISLYNDINCKLDIVQSSLDRIVEAAPLVATDYRNKLNARIAEVVTSGLVDEARLATEVALYADHCAIDEEITRLSAHIVNMRHLMESDEPVGRKLDFLVQELNRETNTIGSKANDLKITAEVLKIKNEIEKIREQAQNIE